MARITLGDQLVHAERERDVLKEELAEERRSRAVLQHEITSLRMRIGVAVQVLNDVPSVPELTEGS
jgi:hypothetical protein